MARVGEREAERESEREKRGGGRLPDLIKKREHKERE